MSSLRPLLATASTALGLVVLSAAPALAASPAVGNPPAVGRSAAHGEFCLDVIPLQAGPVPIYPGGRYCLLTP